MSFKIKEADTWKVHNLILCSVVEEDAVIGEGDAAVVVGNCGSHMRSQLRHPFCGDAKGIDVL